MTTREKVIAGVVGGLLVAYLGFSYGVEPFMTGLSDTDRAVTSRKVEYAKDQHLLASQTQMAKQWTDLTTTGGLATDVSQARDMLAMRLLDLGNQTRVSVKAVTPKSDAPDKKIKEFVELRYVVAVSGSSWGIWRLMYMLETSGVPLRIDGVNVRSTKTGTEPLDAEITVTTVVYEPPVATRVSTRSAASRVRPEVAQSAPDLEALAAKMAAAREREMTGISATGTAPATATAPATGVIR